MHSTKDRQRWDATKATEKKRRLETGGKGEREDQPVEFLGEDVVLYILTNREIMSHSDIS